MYNDILKVSECLDIMRQFGITISEPAFRQSIRKEQVKNTFYRSKKEGINVPMASLMNFMISKVSGNHDAFELGKFYMDQKYVSQPLPAEGIVRDRSYLAKAIFKNEYIYITNSTQGRYYKSYQLFIDYQNYTIHLYDDVKLNGSSSINIMSKETISDIWMKLGVAIDKDILETTCVNIYSDSGYNNFHITGFYGEGSKEFYKPRLPLHERFKKMMEGDKDYELLLTEDE